MTRSCRKGYAYFTACSLCYEILSRPPKPTRVPGEMGLRDVQLLVAIYRAAEAGKKVSIKDVVQVLNKTSRRFGVKYFRNVKSPSN